MINPLKVFTTPEYLFRPRQILVRLQRAFCEPRGELERVRLPWGAWLNVRPIEVIGSNIWYYGVFDLIVAESIARLLDRSETALDIGANIGQMTTLMSFKTGKGGQVFAFEPHPEIFGELAANCGINEDDSRAAGVSLHNIGLSDRNGEAHLQVSAVFSENRGTARVASANSAATPGMIPIRLNTLDDVLPAETKVGLCKIDVEGHELKVFKGASEILQRRGIRDVIFEDFDPYPSPLQQFLARQGFTLFSLHLQLWGPRLNPLTGQPHFIANREGENFLATLEPDRAVARFKKQGWQALKRVN